MMMYLYQGGEEEKEKEKEKEKGDVGVKLGNQFHH